MAKFTLNPLLVSALCKLNTGAVSHDDWLNVVAARITGEARKGQKDGSSETFRFSCTDKYDKATVTTKEDFIMPTGNMWYRMGYLNQQLTTITSKFGVSGSDFTLPKYFSVPLENYATTLAPSGAEPVPSN